MISPKTPIIEYFKTHTNDKSKSTAWDRMVILDSIAELTVRIQGVDSNYIRETLFLMKELLEITDGDILSTRTSGKAREDYSGDQKDRLWLRSATLVVWRMENR